MNAVAAGLAAGLLLAGISAAASQGLTISSLSPPATQGDIAAAIQAMPGPGASVPPPTALDGVQGSSTQYARADHIHAARVQRTVVTTAADGSYTWAFARPIVVPAGKLPPVSYMAEDGGSPIVVQVTGRTMTSDGTTDTHTAVTIRAQRSRTLPATLLAVSALVSFDVFGVPAAGTKVNLWAADPTQ